ncbi:MAG: TorD/DmsD family molecular chaperone [Thermoprotei archaeon]
MRWEEFKLFSYLFMGVRYKDKAKGLLEKVKDRKYYPTVAEILQILENENRDALATEFTRCLINDYGGLKCPPYESWYREGTIYGRVVADLLRLYAQYGLNPEREMPDHIATELEFVAFLLFAGQNEVAEEFLARHLLVWAPKLAEDIMANNYGKYTFLLGKALKEFVEEVSEELSNRQENSQ